jgi:hypothetical protein
MQQRVLLQTLRIGPPLDAQQQEMGSYCNEICVHGVGLLLLLYGNSLVAQSSCKRCKQTPFTRLNFLLLQRTHVLQPMLLQPRQGQGDYHRMLVAVVQGPWQK